MANDALKTAAFELWRSSRLRPALRTQGDYQARRAVQDPTQRWSPDQPVQVPRPRTPFNLPIPVACFSCTLTDARTAPELVTLPLKVCTTGDVITPFSILTE